MYELLQVWFLQRLSRAHGVHSQGDDYYLHDDDYQGGNHYDLERGNKVDEN